jgi:transcriptional regulator with XRE-family HTH domain
MPKLKRAELAAEAARRNLEQLARLGGEIRQARLRRRLKQQALGGRVGLSQSTVSQIELGAGGRLTLDTWQRIAVALDLQLRVDLGRDPLSEVRDVGHLAIQELLLRIGREAGFDRHFELATRPADPRRSSDVGLRRDRPRTLLLIEAWNTFGDLGGSVRSFDRKLAEARDLATAFWGDRNGIIVAGCWVVRSTRVNRALLSRYPELFATRFPGSSRGWTAALMTGSSPPAQPGLLWCDTASTRIFPVRRQASRGAEP